MDAKFLLVFYGAFAIPLLDGFRSRQSLLVGSTVRWTALGFLIVLVGLAFAFRNNATLEELAVFAGIAPLVHLALYTAGSKLFHRRLGRFPADTVFNHEGGLFWDRCFAFVVLGGGAVAIMIVLFNIAD